jgi:hypothetical protein
VGKEVEDIDGQRLVKTQQSSTALSTGVYSATNRNEYQKQKNNVYGE